MAASTITFGDKIQGVASTFPDPQKFTFGNVNEIKAAVNANAALLDVNTAGVAANVAKTLQNRIIVTQSNIATTLGGTIDSTKQYFIDGDLDFTNVNIEVPATGVQIMGYGFDTSKITSSNTGFTLFTSPVGGSGNLLIDGLAIEITGTSSKVYDITGDTGAETIELNRVNFNDCTSLGTITAYRQGLELDTGRFGGTPELTLAGTWSGGYRISISIVRNIDNAMTGNLFTAGGSFVMASRFLTDINADLGNAAGFCDFSNSNFTNPSTFQLKNCIISRGTTFDPDDSTILPNIDQTDLASEWKGNKGISNTFVGGELDVTTEVATTISVSGTFVDLAGTTTIANEEHYDSPANGQLRHLGDTPREFDVISDFILDCSANNEVDLKLVKWDNSASSFSDIRTIRRVINNLVGGRDTAAFSMVARVILDQNDFVKFQVANVGATNNITSELSSYFIVEER